MATVHSEEWSNNAFVIFRLKSLIGDFHILLTQNWIILSYDTFEIYARIKNNWTILSNSPCRLSTLYRNLLGTSFVTSNSCGIKQKETCLECAPDNGTIVNHSERNGLAKARRSKLDARALPFAKSTCQCILDLCMFKIHLPFDTCHCVQLTPFKNS